MSAKMYDRDIIQQAGFPINKYATYSSNKPAKEGATLKKMLRIIDQQDSVNTFKYYGFSETLKQQIERVIYYRGSCCVFRFHNKFYALPYVLAGEGDIDCYGRWSKVVPVGMTGPMNTVPNAKGEAKPFLEGLELIPRYDVADEREFIDEKGNFDVEEANNYLEKSCVIFNDRGNQLSQSILARGYLVEPILDYEERALLYCQTALSNSTGITGIRVGSNDESQMVEQVNASSEIASREQRKFLALTSRLEMQPITNGSTAGAEQFLITCQALDNLRLSSIGLSSGGIYTKASHMLESEQQMNENRATRVIQDRLKQRQMACTIMNSLWGDFENNQFYWCEVSDPVLGFDRDGDGTQYNSEQQQVVDNTDEYEEVEE